MAIPVDGNTGNEFMDLGNLEPVEVSVKIGGKPFVLREPTSADAAAFKNSAMGGAKIEDGKVVGLGKAADAELVLVARCLHQDTKDGWKPVGLEFVKALPARVVGPLFDKAKLIGGLDAADAKAEAAAGKGEPTATTDTSE